MSEMIFSVRTDLERHEVTGFDTMITTVPADVYVTIGGERTLVVPVLMRFLREISGMGASRLGEWLHHADWVLTDDPDVLFERGIMHDCASCRESAGRAMQHMIDDGIEMFVGQLYWAKP